MISMEEFVDSIGNPETEDAAQIAVGKWLAEQINHVPSEITYRCLGHHKGIAFCSYSDKHTLLGMTFAFIEDGTAVIAPADPKTSNAKRIESIVKSMELYCASDEFEYAAMCRDLVSTLGVDPMTYEPIK